MFCFVLFCFRERQCISESIVYSTDLDFKPVGCDPQSVLLDIIVSIMVIAAVRSNSYNNNSNSSTNINNIRKKTPRYSTDYIKTFD